MHFSNYKSVNKQDCKLYFFLKMASQPQKFSWLVNSNIYTANVNRQTTDKLLFSYANITGENL